MLLSLPSDVLPLVLWKLPVRDLVRLARTCKLTHELAKTLAPQMLSDVCAAATTNAAAAAGVDTLQRLAWFCGLRPRIPFEFWNAIRKRIMSIFRGSLDGGGQIYGCYDVDFEYDAVERAAATFSGPPLQEGVPLSAVAPDPTLAVASLDRNELVF